jgi:hypothetical protein
MDYTVAVDAAGEAGQKLMNAAGVSGIPHAFLIDSKGIIRHHGHPMEPRFAQMVKQVWPRLGRQWWGAFAASVFDCGAEGNVT